MPQLQAQMRIDVVIEGVDKTLEDNVRLLLSIEQQKEHALLTEGRIRRLHKKANQEIAVALQPFGYYRPKVISQLNKSTENSWRALYQIEQGPAIRVAQLDLKVNEAVSADAVFTDYMAKLPLKTGDVFRHNDYEQIKTNLLKIASERGFFDAQFLTHRVEVDIQAYSVSINLEFSGGSRYNFGDVQYTQGLLETELMQRYILIEPGQPFLLEELISLQQALNDSDFFQSVEVSPGDPNAATLSVPVIVNLKARKDNRYSLGLGYGTDTGARLRFGWEKPLINEQGHRFNSEFKLSEIGESLSAFYTIPVLNPRTDRLVYSAGLVNETTDTSDSKVQTVGLSLNQSKGAWRQKISLDFQQEEFEVSSIRDRTRLLLPGVSWSRTWGKNSVFTLDGVRFDIDIQGASEQLFSDVDLLQLQSGIKFIQHLGWKNRLIMRARMGTIKTENFNALPSSIRFFAGGSQSVRGYAFKSLGPLDANGDVEGGQHLLVGSVEVDHQWSNKWSGALFYDVGNAINDLDDDLESGAGFGLRWKSPVGPVRIDLANALTKEGTPWRIHINIGPDL